MPCLLPGLTKEGSCMDIDFSPEQELFRATVRDFCDREITRDYVRECDREHRPPTELYRKLGEQGWLGINIPEEYGGSGGGAVEVAILLEELGRAFLDLSFWVFRAVTWGGLAISRDGTEDQKRELLPKVATGELSVCFSLTEPDAGSDAASITLKAEEDGDEFVLNGQKVFTSGFKVSDLAVVAARTAAGEKKHHGITNLLVDARAPGLEWSPIETLGHWPLGTALLTFTDVRVPKSMMLGTLHDGWRDLGVYLRYERLCLSAARTGAAKAALADAIAYSKERRQFDQPISNFQAVAHRLADMQVQTEISEMLVYRYASRLDRGLATPRDAAILKLFACEAYKSVADMGLQVLGGYGYTMEYDLQRHFRESRLGVIGAGTSDIQRNIISKTMGL
ncbi:MAG: acyl-CoA/acyl-ACP dehydrogenase [Acidimicrobiia bacterium]|nr:acyl-CoA/acyl-ACP dehydrogenase [Acidimicrobiia bacterium]MDH4305903.1 acyl-CoA/acyl-ACP dehydrogenase [Acidimicrobiia bacterium]